MSMQIDGDARTATIAIGGFRWCHLTGLDLERDQALIAELADDAITQRMLMEWFPRPDYMTGPAGHILVVKGPNMNAGEPIENLVALRMLITETAVFSFSIKPLATVGDVMRVLAAGGSGAPGTLPASPFDLVALLLDHMLERHRRVYVDMLDMLEAIEDAVLDPKVTVSPVEILTIRRKILGFLRGLGVQADALSSVAETTRELSDTQRRQFDRLAGLCRKLTDMMETLKLRSESVAQMIDQQSTQASERITYMLTLAAGVFLPVNLLAGLFGANVGGVPWLEHPLGFWILVGLLIGIGVVSTLIALWLLRRHAPSRRVPPRGGQAVNPSRPRQ